MMPAARLLALILVFGLASCTSPNAQGGADRAGEISERLENLPSELIADPSAPGADEPTTTLRWAITEPSGITPDGAIDEAGLRVVDLLFDSLTVVGPNGEAQPAAASSWRSQDNARRWLFTLRRGLSFHDGTPVTAGDFVRGWNAVVAAGRPQLHEVMGYAAVRSGSVQGLMGLTAIDDHTLSVQLSAPNVKFPLTAAHPALAPVPAQANQAAFTDLPVGNGPFAMAEPWARGRFVRLSRVDDMGESDEVQEVVFRISDPATAYVRFQQDRVDITPVPGGALEAAIDAYGIADEGSAQPGVHTEASPGLLYLGVNTQTSPWDDVEVRRAVSYAIDRPALIEAVAEGNGASATALVPPAVADRTPNTCTTCNRRVDEAREIFHDRGIRSVTLTHEESPGDELLVRQLRSDLAEVGVRLVARPLPFSELLDALESGEAGLYRFAWLTETPTAYASLAPLVAAGEPQAGVNVNYGRYENPEVDRLLTTARAARDETRRQRLLARAERIVLHDQALIPLYTTRSRLLVADRVTGFRLDPFTGVDLEGVTIR